MAAELEIMTVWDLDLREVSAICERPAGHGRPRQVLAVGDQTHHLLVGGLEAGGPVLAATLGVLAGRPRLVLLGLVFLVIKVVVIPRVLHRIGSGMPVRPVAPGKSSGITLLVAGVLVVVAYAVMLPLRTVTALPTAGAIPLAFAMALIGLFLCVTGRDALGHILGFLVFENGIFGLALLATYGLPGIVEAGVFLDVLIIVLIMEGVVGQVRREHESIDEPRLRELRG
jgi:hydrogenase-4 component E